MVETYKCDVEQREKKFARMFLALKLFTYGDIWCPPLVRYGWLTTEPSNLYFAVVLVM